MGQLIRCLLTYAVYPYLSSLHISNNLLSAYTAQILFINIVKDNLVFKYIYMAKEILMYDIIYGDTSSKLIESMDNAIDEDIVLRINSDGGAVEDAWGVIAKWSEHQKGKKIKIDGRANSMALFFLAYADNARALDISSFGLHRAGYPQWIEDSDLMTDADWAKLDRINGHLRKALEAKIDVAAFEATTKTTLDEVFSNNGRKEVNLSAIQAKKIGLIDGYTKITPAKRKEINALAMRVAAQYSVEAPSPKSNQFQGNNKHFNKMDKETLMAEHPALYNQIRSEAMQAGIDQERDRVSSWMEFVSVDAESVKKGIDEGNKLSQKAMAEFSRKAMSAQALNDLGNAGNNGGATPPPSGGSQTEEQKEITAWTSEFRGMLGINKAS